VIAALGARLRELARSVATPGALTPPATSLHGGTISIYIYNMYIYNYIYILYNYDLLYPIIICKY
jgi:hypothetical protein